MDTSVPLAGEAPYEASAASTARPSRSAVNGLAKNGNSPFAMARQRELVTQFEYDRNQNLVRTLSLEHTVVETVYDERDRDAAWWEKGLLGSHWEATR